MTPEAQQPGSEAGQPASAPSRLGGEAAAG